MKVYAKSEIEIPFVAALFSPSRRDPRLDIPAQLEENPFCFGGISRLDQFLAREKAQALLSMEKGPIEKKSYQKSESRMFSVGKL